MDNNIKDKQSRINIKSKDATLTLFKKNKPMLLLILFIIITTAMIIFLTLKSFSEKGISTGNGTLITDSELKEQLSKVINKGDIYNKAIDGILPQLVGVSVKPDDFYLTDYSKSSTGIILNKDGYIAVPSANLGDAKEAYIKYVTDHGDKTVKAEVIGVDGYTGIGILKVKKSIDSELTFADMGKISLGDNVLVIGSPFGTRDSLNLIIGNVQSKKSLVGIEGSNTPSKINTMFVVAPVYGGNDGGLCMTTNGEFIGIINQKLSSLIGNNNLSAVIPHDELKKIADNIIKKLHPVTFTMGVKGRTIYYEPLKRNVFYVLDVKEGSTAHRGYIKPTDIILKIDGVDVDPSLNIDSPLIGKKAGDTITVEILRLDKTMKLSIKVY